MRHFQRSTLTLLLGLMALWLITALPAVSQQVEDNYFPHENFVQVNPTLPNDKLNFDDDSADSCCAKDYTPSGQPFRGMTSGVPGTINVIPQPSPKALARADFEKSNPHYMQNSTPSNLVGCHAFADLPQLASSLGTPMPDFSRRNPYMLPITSYSTNISKRSGAEYFSDPAMHNTSDFHVETSGGNGMLQLTDVNSFSICMARGGNVAMVANTDNGSILTYNGNDHIYLSGNNTNMLTRTGAGEDVIELYQAQPGKPELASVDPKSETWTSYNIYKTAISGGSDTDALVIKGTPYGTKWCHIGGYRIYGEYFYVVEFALPPTVTQGPRRQRVNIGESVEYVVIKGKRYHLNDFLVHGQPVDTVAKSTPIGDPLPNVSVNPRRSGEG